MSEYKHTIDELIQKQSLPLNAKVTLTKKRIQEWYDICEGNIYVGFSGGKDSTVLLHIARQVFPNIKALFVDTGLEYPEVKTFVKSFDNVDIIRPEMTFREILDKYGWVYPSKVVAAKIEQARRGLKTKCYFDGLDGQGNHSKYYATRYPKWKFLIDSPFKISNYCCDIIKKKPIKKYIKETHTYPIIATLAEESEARKNAWLKTGCNYFDRSRTERISKPLSFWKTQDILQYIKENNVSIMPLYGEIAEHEDGTLYTTGINRTGCVWCPIGVHLEPESNNRFTKLKQTHPKLYNYCMNQLGLKEFLDYHYDERFIVDTGRLSVIEATETIKKEGRFCLS